jgi:hypothetical protein
MSRTGPENIDEGVQNFNISHAGTVFKVRILQVGIYVH